jgi:hypothetical protein
MRIPQQQWQFREQASEESCRLNREGARLAGDPSPEEDASYAPSKASDGSADQHLLKVEEDTAHGQKSSPGHP